MFVLMHVTNASARVSSSRRHNSCDTLMVNKSINRGSKINWRRKRWAVHPVVAVDACFERSSDEPYKTVCAFLRDSDFTPIKDYGTLLYMSL